MAASAPCRTPCCAPARTDRAPGTIPHRGDRARAGGRRACHARPAWRQRPRAERPLPPHVARATRLCDDRSGPLFPLSCRESYRTPRWFGTGRDSATRQRRAVPADPVAMADSNAATLEHKLRIEDARCTQRFGPMPDAWSDSFEVELEIRRCASFRLGFTACSIT